MRGANGDERGFNEHNHEGVDRRRRLLRALPRHDPCVRKDDPLSATCRRCPDPCREAALLATLLAFSALPAAAAAQPRIALFPTPMTQLTPTPPFQPPYNVLPNLFRPPIRSSEVISVGVDASGSVVSVVATQRLVLTRTGDYRLTVPAPATTWSRPGASRARGCATGAILWAGFAGRAKVLSARATLDPRAAAPLLPLAVTISDGSVRLQNTTGTETATYSADGDRADVAKILDSLRADPDGRALGRGTYVHVRGTLTRHTFGSRRLCASSDASARGVSRSCSAERPARSRYVDGRR